jgi:hypothetical protein
VTAPANGQPPAGWDPFNQHLAPQVDAFDVRAFLPPEGQAGVLGVTVLAATGEVTVLGSKGKIAAVAAMLQRALDMVPEPSGLLIPAGVDGGALRGGRA